MTFDKAMIFVSSFFLAQKNLKSQPRFFAKTNNLSGPEQDVKVTH